MAESRPTDDRIEETDETLAPASSSGDKDELLVGLGGEVDIAGQLVDLDEGVGEYEGERESLPPDYQYRVSVSVSDEYGEYPGPGDTDLPLGYTENQRLAGDEGLAYYPPEDPVVLPSDDSDQDLEVATGFGVTLRDSGYDREELPAHIEGADHDLAEDVVEALKISSIISGFRVKVEVEDGVVYLSGVVSTFEDLGRMESVVHNVPGVEDVDADDLDISDESIEGLREISAPQTEVDEDLD